MAPTSARRWNRRLALSRAAMSASAAAAGGGDTSLKRKRTKHALVDVAAAWEPSREGSALNSAAKALDLERLQALVEDGAHPDARDKTGMAALHQAAVLGSLPMVHLLLRAGASVNPADSVRVRPCSHAAPPPAPRGRAPATAGPARDEGHCSVGPPGLASCAVGH